MPKPRSVTNRQLDQLITFMEGHSRMAVGRNPGGPKNSLRLAATWNNIAAALNPMGSYKRTGIQWKSYWHELKYRARKRAKAISAGPGTKPLTSIESRIMALMRNALISYAECGPVSDSNNEGSPLPVHEESLPAEDPVKDEETDSARSGFSEPAEEQQNTHREAEALDLIDDPTEERTRGRLAMAIKDADSEPTLRYYEVRGNTVRETRSGRRAPRRPLAQPAEDHQSTLRRAEELDLDLTDGDPTEDRRHSVAIGDVDRDREPTVRYYEVRGNTLQETGGGRRPAPRPPVHRQNSAVPILRARRLYTAQRIQIEERRLQIEERKLEVEQRIARSGERIADTLEAILHCL